MVALLFLSKTVEGDGLMKGEELYYNLFGEENDDLIYELEHYEGVTDYEEKVSYIDGWYIVSEITFKYEGKTYSFEKREHSSDNVSDTTYMMDTFTEVRPLNKYVVTFYNRFAQQVQTFRVKAESEFRAGRLFYMKHPRKSYHDCIQLITKEDETHYWTKEEIKEFFS